MKRSETRILSTHTGSLPRPPLLTELYARRSRGAEVDEQAVAKAGREALADSVTRQIGVGLDVINNGEQQRESFVLYLRHRLSGLGGRGSRPGWADVDAYPDFKATIEAANAETLAVSNRHFIPRAIGPVAYIDSAPIDQECDDFNASIEGRSSTFAESFMTAPSPGILAAIVENDYYDSHENYVRSLGRALQVEYEAIVRKGLVLQIDCPDLAMERHVSFQHRSTSEFLGFVEMVVDTINAALSNIPADRVRLHVCWGNYEGPHDRDIDLETIWPVIKTAKVGAFVLPFANPRHAHETAVLQRSPMKDDQLVIAGVIDTVTNYVEHPEVVADRLVRVAEAVGDPTRVLAGTDCGFDTAAGMGRVSRDVVWAKLGSLTEGARLASDRLFGKAERPPD